MEIGRNVIDADCRELLEEFLNKYTNPAFGTLTKKEIDLLVFEMLEKVDVINEKDMYENQLKLKITSTKIRSMFYELELRRRNKDSLDSEMKEIIKKPVILKSGEIFKLQIDNPLLIDHIRAKLKELGYVSDGSFSRDIVTLSDEGYFALINSLIDEADKNKYEKLLIAEGAMDKSWIGFLKAATKNMAINYAGEKATEILEELLAESITEKNIKKLKNFLPQLFDSIMETVS